MKRLNQEVDKLILHESPQIWTEWLMHIQAFIIEQGYCESLTRKGSSEFASRFLELQMFFQRLKNHSPEKS